MRLFCCLGSRDIFIRSYTKYFGLRLLNRSYQSKEFEELMIQKLKAECGLNTVNKLVSMLHDINTSQILIKEFKEADIS